MNSTTVITPVTEIGLVQRCAANLRQAQSHAANALEVSYMLSGTVAGKQQGETILTGALKLVEDAEAALALSVALEKDRIARDLA